MVSHVKSDMNYIRLGQFHTMISQKTYYSDQDLKNLKIFLQKYNFDINYQISSDSLLAKRKPFYSGYTALHLAVETDNAILVELILSDKNVDFTRKACNTFTPLRLFFENHKNLNHLISYRYDRTKIMNLLLKSHVNLSNKTNPSCKSGISHMHIACFANNVQVVDFFLKSGVDVNLKVNLESVVFPGYTPLHFAIGYGKVELVNLLLKNGADVNQKNGNGMTSLQFLVDKCFEINNYNYHYQTENSIYKKLFECEIIRINCIIETLINELKKKNFNEIDDFGLSLFHISCLQKNTILIDEFLAFGLNAIDTVVNFDSPKWAGFTALHFAACSDVKTVILLLNKGANIEAKDATGTTPFDLCLKKFNISDIIDILKSQPSLGDIKFQSGPNLISIIELIKANLVSMNNFQWFNLKVLKEITTTLPMNSSLWSGYTIIHLIVTLTRIVYNINSYSSMNDNYFPSDDFSENIYFRNSDVQFNKALIAQDANGMTPLHLAFRMGKKDTCKFLIDYYEIHIKNVENLIDYEGLSILQIACILNDDELVDKLLRKKFDGTYTIQNDVVWFDKKFKHVVFKSGFSLYNIAALNGSKCMINILIENKVKLEVLKNQPDDLTIVHFAFLNYCSRKTLGAIFNIPETCEIDHTLKNGLSHLHVACYIQNYEAVKKLLTVSSNNVVKAIDCETISSFRNNLTPYNGDTPLHLIFHIVKGNLTSAQEKKYFQIIQLLVSKGADILAENAAGLNIIHLMIRNYIKKSLIKRVYEVLKKKNVKYIDAFGFNGLHFACIIEDKYEIESLLKSGQNPNSKIKFDSPIYSGNTPLHILSNHDNCAQKYELIQLLINYGADLTLKNTDNETPLHLLWNQISNKLTLTSKNNDKTLMFIDKTIKQAKPYFCKENPVNNRGLSHFHISCGLGETEVVKNFIKSGLDVNEPSCHFDSSLKGFNSLHFAMYNKQINVIKLLLQNDANLNFEDSRGFSPLQIAAISFPSIIPKILSKFQVDLQGENSFAPSVLEILLDKLNLKQKNNQDLIKAIFSHDVKINFVDFPVNKRVISYATAAFDNQNFCLFIKNSNDILNVDENGKNAIHNLTTFYNIEYESNFFINVNLLLEKGCNINHRDNLGRTPLHDAAENSYLIVKKFLLLGADVNICDNEGRTPYLISPDYPTRSVFQDHLIVMYSTGLYIDQKNIINYKNSKDEIIEIENNLLKMKTVLNINDVNLCGLNLRDLFTERIIILFSTMNIKKRMAILKALSIENLLNYYKEPNVYFSLLMYQYRRILTRQKLFEPAKYSFYNRIFKLPLLCIECIFLNLKNNDLENLTKI